MAKGRSLKGIVEGKSEVRKVLEVLARNSEIDIPTALEVLSKPEGSVASIKDFQNFIIINRLGNSELYEIVGSCSEY